jgi:prepilin-type processing-associated H-X9-DG protein
MITVPAASPMMSAPPMAPAPSSGRGLSTAAIVLICIFGVLACCGVLVVPGLLLPAVQAARSAAKRTQSANNLRQIGLALISYHDEKGTFPPAYTVDANGKPLHSWRVLILPYIDESGLFSQIRLDEPWDSPHNRQFHSRMPMCLRAPGETSGQTTDYVAISGQGTIFDGDKPSRMMDITDGTSNTLLVVEANGRNVNWMEPKDIDIQELAGGNVAGLDGVSGKYPGGANVLFSDGSVTFMSPTSGLSNLRELSTKSGGEVVNRF